MSVETTSVWQLDGRARLAQRTSSRSVEQTPDLHALNSATREAVGPLAAILTDADIAYVERHRRDHVEGWWGR